MKTCPHTNVCIIPTYDTSWGLDNKYDLVCFDCDHVLLSDSVIPNIKEFLQSHAKELISGQKYL